MILTNKAKRKWFKENVNQFELYYYDCFKNVRLVQYYYFEGLFKTQDRDELYCSELRKMARKLDKLSACDIFWAYKKLRFTKDINKKCVFRFNWD